MVDRESSWIHARCSSRPQRSLTREFEERPHRGRRATSELLHDLSSPHPLVSRTQPKPSPPAFGMTGPAPDRSPSVLTLRRRPEARAYPTPDLPGGQAIDNPKRQRHSHRQAAVEHSMQHRPRRDGHDRLAAPAAVPPKPQRQLLWRLARNRRPQNHALAQPVSHEPNGRPRTRARRLARRASIRSCRANRWRFLRPELDVAIKVDDSLRALLLDRVRSTTGIICQDGPRRPFLWAGNCRCSASGARSPTPKPSLRTRNRRCRSPGRSPQRHHAA